MVFAFHFDHFISRLYSFDLSLRQTNRICTALLFTLFRERDLPLGILIVCHKRMRIVYVAWDSSIYLIVINMCDNLDPPIHCRCITSNLCGTHQIISDLTHTY